jgi:hypothetical protein
VSEELNCSEGARMLIERMQTHPKDFKPGGRFYRIAEQVMRLAPRGYGELSDRDDTALSEAYGKYLLEPQLTEFVVDEIFNGEKRRAEEQQNTTNAYTANLAKSMMNTKSQIASNMLSGFHDSRLMWPSGVPPQNPAQGQVLWAEQEKPKAGRDWFEHEKRILREMTDRTLAKLKRNKSK